MTSPVRRPRFSCELDGSTGASELSKIEVVEAEEE